MLAEIMSTFFTQEPEDISFASACSEQQLSQDQQKPVSTQWYSNFY